MSPATPHRSALQPSAPHPATPCWDLFCRVIDNHGDAGVCWRLATELATRGQPARLFIDDASALAWMAPQGHAGVQVLSFDEAAHCSPAPAVVEAFGCDPPAAYVQAMAAAACAPVWLNLEYLSAEAYVERCHILPSPQRNGLTKWFFYPGFTAHTGGLLREADLSARQAAFQPAHWLRDQGINRRAGERLISLFCYAAPPPAALHAVLQALATEPTCMLLTPPAQTLFRTTHPTQGDNSGNLGTGSAPWPASLRLHALPWLSQRDYDHLLWACDLNFVRGEDSLVRAHWAGKPFVWHIYPQHDGVHAGKLDALLQRMQAAPAVARLWRAWNGTQTPQQQGAHDQPHDLAELLSTGGLRAWTTASQAWRSHLCGQPDLVTQLQRFVQDKTPPAPRGPVSQVHCG